MLSGVVSEGGEVMAFQGCCVIGRQLTTTISAGTTVQTA